ncbi:hypothetical protein D9M71_698260 [compost metagenome]
MFQLFSSVGLKVVAAGMILSDEFRFNPWSIEVVLLGASAEVSIFRSVSTPLMILPFSSTP